MSNFQEISRQIQNRSFAPVYFLGGEEPYYIDALSKKFEEAVPESERDFNLLVFYGKETNAQTVIQAARGFPMFGDRLMVLVKDAAQMKDLNELSLYLEHPMPTTVLVIEHRFKKLDNRSKLKNALAKRGVIFQSDKLKENRITEWILNYCADRQIAIHHQDAHLIAQYLGTDLQKIANEIEKIVINQPSEKEITSALIKEFIGISKEFSVFELPEAVFDADAERLSRMLNFFAGNPSSAPMPVVLAGFYNFLKSVLLSYALVENFQEDRKRNIWSHHRALARRHPITLIHRLFAVLEEYSRRAVGIGDNQSDTYLLQEMVGKMRSILSVQSAS